MPSSRRSRRWRVRALAAFVAAVGAALVFEIALRIAGYPEPQPRTYPGEHEARPSEHFVADARLGWRMRAGDRLVYATEGREHEYLAGENGFRCGSTPSGGARTLAVVGDSFAWGAGVGFEETFAARAARSLGWRVANFGMPGYGIDQVSEALRVGAIPEKPDLVLVAVYSRDFERTLSAYREVEGQTKPVFRLRDGELVPRTMADTPNAAWRWLDENSHAFTALKLASWRLAMRWPHGEWWELNRAFLERMHADCEAARIPVAFVHVPTNSWRAFPAVGDVCAARGVPWLDPAARVPERPDGLYYASDKHLNDSGHAWFAERIVEWLRAEFPELTR